MQNIHVKLNTGLLYNKQNLARRGIVSPVILILNLKKKIVKWWSIALCGAESWTFRKTDQKSLPSFDMWCCLKMEKISFICHVKY
jgi:hypothetical protein